MLTIKLVLCRYTQVLLQLASAHHCILLRLGLLKGDEEQLAAACGPGTSLHALLAAPEVFVAGVGVTKDAQLLADQYGLTVSGIIELAPVAQQKGAGLRTLCHTVLARELPKVHSILYVWRLGALSCFGYSDGDTTGWC